jgi:hypothetical protein
MKAYQIRKIKSELEESQKRCTRRLMSLEDVQRFVNALKSAREKALGDKLGRKYLIKVEGCRKYAVPNSYDYPAMTTYVTGYVTKYGRISVHVGRGDASRVPYGGLVQKIEPIFE